MAREIGDGVAQLTRGPRRGVGRPSRWALGLAVLVMTACSGSAGTRAPALSQPRTGPERSSGCIDTPFVGGDQRASTMGVQCGRESAPDRAMLAGRVVREEIGGLPGAAIEGAWVTLHSVERGRAPRIDALPPAIARAQTGPQGDFVLAPSATPDGHELLLAVWLSLDETPLTVRPVEGAGTKLILTVRIEDVPTP